jgi:general secretion pathway protein G
MTGDKWQVTSLRQASARQAGDKSANAARSPHASRFTPHVSAFTLIELLVVIAIIGVLATLSAVAYTAARNQAKVAKAQHDVDTIVTALKTLESDTGYWPGHKTVDQVAASHGSEVWDLSTGAAGLVQTDGGYSNWNGPYIGKMPVDPWGHNYFFDPDYTVNSVGHVVIGSFGPNGVGQNVYDSDNIYKIIL